MKEELEKTILKVAGEFQSEGKKEEELVQLVILEVDKEEYAVPIADASEIVKISNVTPIPGVPEFIRGILNLRGKVVVVIDLENRFNLTREQPSPTRHIVIVELGENTFGVIVDKVTEVIKVPKTQIQPPPSLVSSKIHADYVKGVIVLPSHKVSVSSEEDKWLTNESRLLILLDLPKLLREKELLQIGQAIQEANIKSNN